MSDAEIVQALVEEVDQLAQKVLNWGNQTSDPIVIHAAATIAGAGGGLRRAILKAGERAIRQSEKAARHVADQDVRRYDALTLELAALRGIEPAAMQEIRDAAKVRARQAAARGSISDQMKEVETK